MAEITLGGNPIHTLGELPAVGTKAPDFSLTANDLSVKRLTDFSGKKVILNIFPSLDTSTCATSVRTFNEKASSLDNIVVICVSRDLPFAQSRFCGTEGLKNVITLSDFANGSFGKDYALEIIDGPMASLHSRAIVVIDENGTISYTEQVGEIADEPNYEAAISSL